MPRMNKTISRQHACVVVSEIINMYRNTDDMTEEKNRYGKDWPLIEREIILIEREMKARGPRNAPMK